MPKTLGGHASAILVAIVRACYAYRFVIAVRALLLAVLVASTHGPAQAQPLPADTQTLPFNIPAVTIVLPPKLMAAHTATLAVFGFDGRLAPGIVVVLSDGESVTTDHTGRAHFTAPARATFLLARVEGVTAATLIDPAVGANEPKTVTSPPIASIHDNFWLCGPGLQGDANADSVSINGHPALVLAASPECLVVLPPPQASSGPAFVSVNAPGVHWTASITFVSLAFDRPHPALLPGQEGRLAVRVDGSPAKLKIKIENASPGVLRFSRGDVQQVRTGGGANNSASIKVQAIRSGDFSFRAHIVPPPDPGIAASYLRAAAPLAPRNLRLIVEKLAHRLERHRHNVKSERRDLVRVLDQSIPGDFRTLLSAAYSAL